MSYSGTQEDKKAKRLRYLHNWRDRLYAQGKTARGTLRKIFDDDPRIISNLKRRTKV